MKSFANLPSFDHSAVQAVYLILTNSPPPPADNHWEGWVARRIVAYFAEHPSKGYPGPELPEPGLVLHPYGAAEVYGYTSRQMHEHYSQGWHAGFDTASSTGTPVDHPLRGFPKNWSIGIDGDKAHVFSPINGPGGLVVNKGRGTLAERILFALVKDMSEQPTTIAEDKKPLAPEDLNVGAYYGWTNQPETLVYLGKKHYAGNGYWHQFAKAETPTEVWSEVRVSDLSRFERREAPESDTSITYIERAARICEDMRPVGGRAWTTEQAACYEALTSAAEAIRAIAASEASEPASTIPRLENCGRYYAEDYAGQWYYLNHAGQWATCPLVAIPQQPEPAQAGETTITTELIAQAREAAKECRRVGLHLRADLFDSLAAALEAQQAVPQAGEPHPPSRHCMCEQCRPSFQDEAPQPTQAEAPSEREAFEAELRRQCFQRPTPEAYELAWCMWQARAALATHPEQAAERVGLTDEQIDRVLSTVIPGGSSARDWFLPHELPKGLANVREVVRLMLATAHGITTSGKEGGE